MSDKLKNDKIENECKNEILTFENYRNKFPMYYQAMLYRTVGKGFKKKFQIQFLIISDNKHYIDDIYMNYSAIR